MAQWLGQFWGVYSEIFPFYSTNKSNYLSYTEYAIGGMSKVLWSPIIFYIIVFVFDIM